MVRFLGVRRVEVGTWVVVGWRWAVGQAAAEVADAHEVVAGADLGVDVQPPCDPLLASFDVSSYRGVHSKTSVLRVTPRLPHLAVVAVAWAVALPAMIWGSDRLDLVKALAGR